MQLMYQVVIGLDVAEAAFNPTPGDSNGVDQDLYEQNGNDWIRWFLRLALSRVKTMNLLTPLFKCQNLSVPGKTTPGSTSFSRLLFPHNTLEHSH